MKFSDARLKLFDTVSPEQAGLPLPVTFDSLAAPPLTGLARQRFFDSFWDTDQQTLAETYDARVLAGWRICYYLANLRGALQAGQGLEDSLDGPDLFYRPWTAFAEFRDVRVRSLLEEEPLALLPPPIPRDEPLEHYEPAADHSLSLFLSLVGHVGLRLSLHASQVRQGFLWMTEADTCRAAFPQLEDLIRFERRVSVEAMEGMTTEGFQDTFEKLRAKYEFSHAEAKLFMKLGRRQAHSFVDPEDLQGIKAMVLLRLQRMSKKAEDAFDHRGAAMIERELWRVARDQAHQEEIDDLEDMANVVKESASKKRKPPTRGKLEA